MQEDYIAEEELEELDDKWIHDFEENDKLYEDFYLEDVYYTDIHCVYVDRSNNIEKITEESFLMSNKNEITKQEIIQILKKNTLKDNKKYSLIGMLKCNIDLKPEDLNMFITCSNVEEEYINKFVTPLKISENNNISVKFEKTINMFQDLNDLFIILYECPPNSFSKTRKKTQSTHKKTLKKYS